MARAGKFLCDVNLSVLCLCFLLDLTFDSDTHANTRVCFASPPCPSRTHFPVAWHAYPASANFSAMVVSLSGRPYADAGGIQSCCVWFLALKKSKGSWHRVYLFLFERYTDVKNASDDKRWQVSGGKWCLAYFPCNALGSGVPQ